METSDIRTRSILTSASTMGWSEVIKKTQYQLNNKRQGSDHLDIVHKTMV